MVQNPTVATAFYHDPPIWVGASLVPSAATAMGDIDFRAFRDLVVDKALPCGIRFAVSREGLFMFDFRGWPACDLDAVNRADFDVMAAAALRQTQIMNAYLAILYTRERSLSGAIQRRTVVTPSARIVMSDPQGGDLTSTGLSWGSQDSRAMDLSFSSFPRHLPIAQAVLDPRLTGRPVISVKAVEDAADILSTYLQAYPDDGALLADMFEKAAVYFAEHNNPAALLNFWPVNERLLFELESQNFPSKSPNSYGASNNLLNAGVIDQATYDLIDRARKARNDWVHDLDQTIDADDAMSAGLACQALLSKARGLDLDCLAGRQITA